MNETQELALEKVFNRVSLTAEKTPSGTIMPMPVYGKANDAPMSFDAFKALAHDSHMGCVMVPWAGMWLGIEPDGYTHS